MKRRILLNTLVCVAMVILTLVSMVPAFAATPNTTQPLADWPILLEGKDVAGTTLHSVSLTQAQFEAMVTAAYPSNENEAYKWQIPKNYHDSTTGYTGIYEKGLALYRLVSLIDDYDTSTFNTALYGSYSLRITGINLDGSTYAKTIAPSSGAYSGFAFGGSNENIFIANKIQYPTNVGFIQVSNSGSGYTLAPTVTITPAAGDTTGSGATAVAYLGTGSNANKVSSIDVVTTGSNYTATPTITITPAAGDTTGSGATAITNTVTGNSNWYDMPELSATNSAKLFFPTVVSGSGVSSSGNRIGAVTHIELLNLPNPTATVSILPSSQAVANGASFDANLGINTNTSIRGWQATVNFDAAKLTLNSVTEGTFLSAYATANGGGTVAGGSVTINNTTGVATIPGWAISGAGTSGPSGSGTLAVLHFTAKAAIDNYAAITPADVIVSAPDGNNSLFTITVAAGQAAIGNVPMPDLAISSASTTKTGDSTYTITYTITNSGNLAAGASTASVVIDSGTPITAAIASINPGASISITTAAQTISGATDSIVITADSAGVVNESNETNNSRTIGYALVGDQGNTIINSNVLAALSFTAPSAIDPWNLSVGSNSRTGDMVIKCNSDWQVQVSDQTGNLGKLTKWLQSQGYTTSVKLVDSLSVGADSTVILTATPSTIATGSTAGQSGDNGQNKTITFIQTVHYSDPVLTGGYSYHIVLTFTASVTL